jgi:hypothetical protein
VNFTEVNGTALRYDLDGNGLSTLVLIHEMGGTLESRDLVAPLLSGKRRICATTREEPGCRKRCAACSPSTPWSTTLLRFWMRLVRKPLQGGLCA